MATSTRKHQVFGQSEQPSMAALNAAFASINDIVPVANTTDRATVAAAVSPSTSRPLWVYRADAASGRELEVTTDGSTWRSATLGTDTGWTNVSTRSGFTFQNNNPAQVRRIANQVYMRWGWTGTGLSANAVFTVGDIAAQFRPAQTVYVKPGTNSAATGVQGVVYSSGVVEVRTGTTLPDYVLFDAISWLVD